MAETVHDSDIICTTTAARSPILNRSAVPTCCHINAIGSSALGFQELHEDVYEHSVLFTDCNRSVLASAECVIRAVKKGLLPAQEVGIEIGTLQAHRALIEERSVSIFKSAGLAVQDLVFAREAIRRRLSTCR